MHRSFILSIKRGLNTCVLLGISSGVTTYAEVTTFLGVTNSSGVTTLKTSFASWPAFFSSLDAGYSNSLASASPTISASNMLTRFEGFPGFL